MKTIIPSFISKVETMADKSLRVKVDTQELDPERMKEVFQIAYKYGYFVFDEASFNPELIELPKFNFEKGGKSPSERLRSVLYVYFEQHKSMINEDFESFYIRKMNSIIDDIKLTLN